MLDAQKILQDRFAYLDLTKNGQSPLQVGDETVFVNAAIMNVKYKPRNAPWLVDLELPLTGQAGANEVSA